MPIVVPGGDTAAGLILLSELKAYMNLTIGDASDPDSNPAILVEMGKAISDIIETMDDRSFLEASYDEHYDIAEYGQDELQTNQWPITNATLAAFKIYSVSWSLGVATETELTKDDDYMVYANSGLIKFAVKRTVGLKRIRIVYKAGYTSYALVPRDLRQIIKSWVYRKWTERRHPGRASETTPGGSTVTYGSSDLTEKEEKIILAYARPDV